MRRDVTPAFLTTELIAWLDQHRIGLAELIEAAMTDAARQTIDRLLVREDTLSELAAIKQDAKYFKPHMMARERKKRETLAPIYRVATAILPTLGISQRNLDYYASLAHFYTACDLRKFRSGQSALYLLCYAWQRYRQLRDNLVDALRHHTQKFEDDSKARAEHEFMAAQVQRQRDTSQVGRLLLLYVDDI